MELYHYRSVETALKEITNGTFHYSERDELNDPIEGYVKLYWQGDWPAWEGLFRNYICSLCDSICSYLLAAKYTEIEKRAVLLDIHCSDDMEYGELLQNVADQFIEHSYIQKLMNYLVEQNICCSVKLLRLLLRLVHEISFSICMSAMKERRLVPEDTKEYYIPMEEIFSKFPEEALQKVSAEEKHVLLEIGANLLEDMLESRFMAEQWGEDQELTQRQTWYKVRIDFPAIYTKQIQEIIYPKVYVVCFSTDRANSAMWGNYADNHRGVCLVYRSTSIDGKETISVRSQMSVSNQRISYSFRNDTVSPVKYDGPMIQRNFFESLGRMTYKQIASWLISKSGEKSRFFENYKNEQWREKYWVDYKEKCCRKLPHWQHEKEYRLLLSDSFHKHTPKERLIEYAPDSLVGVIFGIKTSEYDKIRIIRAIKETGRLLPDFNFYQADYDDERQCIAVRKKMLFLH